MARIQYTKALSTGIRVIDNDHRMLIDIANALHDAVDRKAADEEVASALDALIRYVEEHFEREEKFMASCNYPDIAAHMKQHQGLAQTVYRLQRLNRTEPAKVSWTEVLDFIDTWLTHHIQKVDMAYVPYVRNLVGTKTAPTDALAPLQALTVRVPPDSIEALFTIVNILAEGGPEAQKLLDCAKQIKQAD